MQRGIFLADCEKSTTISKYFSATPTEEGKTVEEAVVKNDKPKVVEEKSVEKSSQPIIRYISLNSIQMTIGKKFSELFLQDFSYFSCYIRTISCCYKLGTMC